MADVVTLRGKSELGLRDFWSLLDAWVDYLKAQDLDEGTILIYERALVRTLRDTRTTPETLTRDVYNRYLYSLNVKAGKRSNTHRAARNFFPWALRRGFITEDPSDEARVKKKAPQVIDYYRPDEMLSIIEAAADTRHRDPGRRQAVVVLLFETGARIESLANVEPRDVKGNRIVFRVSKNDRPYSLPLTPAAKASVEWLLKHPHPRGKGTLIGVSKSAIWEYFNTAAATAGMPVGRRHPHLARHTAATLMMARTKDPSLVRTLLNHSTYGELHRYAATIDGALEEAMFKSLGKTMDRWRPMDEETLNGTPPPRS